MLAKNVRLFSYYRAMLAGELVTIKIISQRPGGGWDAMNTATLLPVYVRSAQRLRREITPEQADALAEEGL